MSSVRGILTALEPIWFMLPGRTGCGRDPDAGPGTCSLWWEGCPMPEDRNCYQVWKRRRISWCVALAAAAIVVYQGGPLSALDLDLPDIEANPRRWRFMR